MNNLKIALEPYAKRQTLRTFVKRPDILWFTPRGDLTDEERREVCQIITMAGVSIERDEFPLKGDATLRLGRVNKFTHPNINVSLKLF